MSRFPKRRMVAGGGIKATSNRHGVSRNGKHLTRLGGTIECRHDPVTSTANKRVFKKYVPGSEFMKPVSFGLKAVMTPAVLLAGMIGSVGSAYAGGPLVSDIIAPPPNINIGMVYNIFSTAGSFYTSNGTKVGDTHIATDTPVLRYVRTFNSFDGIQTGIQVIAPHVSFLGDQHVGPGPLSANSGFAEPQLSAFIFPVNDPAHDQYLNFTYFLSPPVGGYSSTASLNSSTNNWVNNIEAGYSHILFGKPKGERMDLIVWADAYFYGNNTDLNNTTLGVPNFFGKAKEETQNSEQFIVYLPYFFHPATAGYVGLGFEQTLGGKQTITFQNVPNLTVDTGNRINVTSVSLNAGSFVAPTVFVQGQLQYDVRVRGGAKSTTLLFQIGKIF